MRKLFLVTGCVILLFIGLRSYSTLFFSIKNHTCCAQQLLSDEYLTTISHYISDHAHVYNSLHDYALHIKKIFPVIKTVKMYVRPLTNVVEIEPYEPICSINNSLIFTANNKLFPQSFFSCAAVETVPAISVAHDIIDTSVYFLADIFNALPFNFNNFYNLDCINEHYIRLVDKNNSRFAIVCAREQQNYQRLFEYAENIKKNLADRGAFDKDACWIADARFARYIIAYKA